MILIRLKALAIASSCALTLALASPAALAQTEIASTSTDLPSAPTPHTAPDQSRDDESPQQTPPAQQPTQQQQPPSNPNEPSLGDLGISPSQTQGSAKQQAMLEKRTHMLKVHQTLGLITTAPMVAALVTGPLAKAKGRNGQTITEPTDANLDFHIALGGLATGLYWTTAYYAEFAPKVPGTKKRGAIRLHEALAFIHGPGMILTPIMGIDAWKQENAGEKVHGFASAHGTVAWITVAAYGASEIAISWPIHLKL